MTISPIQYPIYQQPNFYQQCLYPCVSTPQFANPQQQFTPQPIIPPLYPEDNYYLPSVYSHYKDTDIRKNLLYSQNKMQELLDFGANKQMKNMYPLIKDNKDFKELLNSKYYQNGVGFINLLDTIAYVKFKRDESLRPSKPVQGYIADDFFKNLRTDYSKYDTADYLRILNNFVKSDKISDDLKNYYIAKESKNLDSYYGKMDKINESDNIVQTLL